MSSANNAQSSRKWTIDAVVNAESATGLRISPDSRWLAWVKQSPDDDKAEMLAHIFLSSLTDEREIQLTRGTEDCTEPRWAPDGKRIAFLSERPNPKSEAEDDEEAEAQIWLINPAGGEAWPLTENMRGIKDFAWRDNDTLIVCAQEHKSLYEQELKDNKDEAFAVEDERQEPPVRLFEVAAKSGKAKHLTRNTDRIKWMAVSPDGARAVVAHERSLRYNYDHALPPQVVLYDLRSGSRKPLPVNLKHIDTIHWAGDSQGFYAIAARTTHPRYLMAYVLEVHHFDVPKHQSEQVPLDWDKGLTFAYSTDRILAATENGFLAVLANGVHNKAARFTKTDAGWRRTWLTGQHAAHLQELYLARDGKTLVYQHSKADAPISYFRARLDADSIAGPTKALTPAPDYDDLPKARCEVVRWPGAGGDIVEGLLYYPHDYQAGKRYPLVVTIHGGPFGSDFDAWEEHWASSPNLLCSRGVFAFRPNYHGSSNYGLAFAESIANGKYYELPVADIEKGVDHLIERGLADPQRLAVMGWSNGAILTMALIVHNQRYKAAIAGAGGSEWVGDWGTCEFGLAFDHYYFGKSPLEDPQLYIKLAPFYQFARVRTPTLLHQGTEDRVVPVHHGWMQFRALQQHSKAPVRLVLFPGEEHDLGKLGHQRRKLKEDLAWLDRHLLGKPADEQTVKAGSPLDRLLKLRAVARHGNRYGVLIKGVLAPETVRHGELEVGRFEVTRAQFAEFERNYRVAPGTQNYPANGISFDQAKAYTAWLGKQTGEAYRLGSAAEMRAIYDEPADEENTLDYWAGCKVTPDDANRLGESFSKTLLLKEVGVFAPSGEEPALLYDVGGNVAEYAVSANGQAVLLGGSADRPANAMALTPHIDCVGFRVVRDRLRR